MRVADGRIFDVAEPAQPPPREVEPPPPVPPELPPPPPPRPQEELEPKPVSVLWTSLVLAIAGVFVVGLLYPWDDVGRSWVDRHFHPSVGAAGNVLSALAPLALIAGTVVAVLLAHRSAAWRLLAGGLLVGLGVAGAAKYGGLVANQLDKEGTRTDSIIVLAFVALSSCALAVLGTKLAAGGLDRYVSGRSKMIAGGLALVGAGLVVVGSAVEYNGTTSKSILEDDGWFAADPLVGALVALGAIFVGRGIGHAGAGALIAIGVLGLALWPRFIGVPILIDDRFGSAAPGGFLGLLGSACLLAAGVIVAWPHQTPPATTATPDEPHAAVST